jgi:hypothetical protein
MKRKGKYQRSEEVRRLQSIAMKQFWASHTHSRLGKCHSDKTKVKISETNKGRLAWNKGLSWPEEIRQKISEAKKRFNSTHKSPLLGMHPSKESCKKMSQAQRNSYASVAGKKRRLLISISRIGTKASEETKNKMKLHWNGHRFPKGQPSWIKGKHHSEKTKKKISLSGKGKGHSEEWRRKVSKANTGKRHSEESKLKMSLHQLGEKGPRWMGGISKLPYAFTFSVELKKQIKDRDGYACKNPFCRGKSDKLVVHHIDYDKKNSSLNNLITLCSKCHGSTTGDNRIFYTFLFQNALANFYRCQEANKTMRVA